MSPIRRPPLLIRLPTFRNQPIFADPADAREAVMSLYRVQWWNPFSLHGFVVMPTFCEVLVSQHPGFALSGIIDRYKRSVDFCVNKGSLWKPGIRLLIPEDCQRTLGAMYRLPLENGLCLHPKLYPWSSASGRWDVLELPRHETDNGQQIREEQNRTKAMTSRMRLRCLEIHSPLSLAAEEEGCGEGVRAR